MSETASETNPVAETPAAEPKLGKAKLAKAKKAAPPPEGTVAQAEGEKVPRVNPYAGKKIYLNRANEKIGAEGKNPKRPGSNGHQAFSFYVDGITVDEFLAKCKEVTVTNKNGKSKPVGDLADIRWDLSHEFITLA